MNNNIKYFDLFAGIGGFRAGLERAGGFECVGHCEIDKFANKSYTAIHNIKESEIYYEDIKDIDTKTMPDFDLLCAGFPCQSFSLAGKRGGFGDPRGSLFFEITRLLRDKQPAYLLLENVPGLLSHDRGETFAAILTALCELGYGVQWQILNSKDFGVPQARRRVYIVGCLDKERAGKILPVRNSNAEAAIYTGSRGGDTSGLGGDGLRIHSKDKAGYTLAYPGDSIKLAYSGIRKARVGRGLGFTLTTQANMGVVTEDKRIRRLTPRECLRLQGFTDDQIDCILAVTSDYQAYRQAGNAVTIPVVETIGKRIKNLNNTLAHPVPVR